MQIKTQSDINSPGVKWLLTEKVNLTRPGQGFGEHRTLTTRYWWGCTVIHYGTLKGGLFSKQSKADHLNEPAIPFVGIHPKEMESAYARDIAHVYSIIGHNSQTSHYVCQ